MPTDPASPAIRIEAIEDILIEKGLIEREMIDSQVDTYVNDLGPMIGARLVARAWVDPEFKAKLMADTDATIEELGLAGAEVDHVEIKENAPDTHHVVVCTLCSCYPWSLLGLPPNWYKSPEYRTRLVKSPRKVLAEMGLELADSTYIHVWDSSAETRFFVLPQRPHGTDSLNEDELAELVTRDSMIGVGLATQPSS